MLTGIVGDIHGNAAGLAAACAALRARGATHIVCCGDIVGYSAAVRPVMQIVHGEGIVSVAGNHDAMMTARSWPLGNDLKSAPLAYAANELSDVDRAFLGTLPVVRSWRSGHYALRMLHGMPADPLDGYLYPHLADLLPLPEGADFLIVGHTHMQFRAEKAGGAILNPGSCGLGRDGDPRAACMIFDDATGATTMLRVAYDPSSVAMANASAGFDPVINDYLFAGQKLPAHVRPFNELEKSATHVSAEGLLVVAHAAGFLAVRDETMGAGAVALELEDGSILVRSTPVGYRWRTSHVAEAPEGFRIGENRVAWYYERSLGSRDAVAESVIRAIAAAEALGDRETK